MTVFQEMGISKSLNQTNSMILISFSSAEDALFNDVKKYNTFSSQSTENQPFCFFWDTRYILILLYHVNTVSYTDVCLIFKSIILIFRLIVACLYAIMNALLS